MRRQDALVLSVCAACVVTAALYVARPPAPIYYPLEHVWRWQSAPGVAMFWYGRSLVALAGGVLTLLAGRPILDRVEANSAAVARLIRPASWVTLAVLVVTLGHIVVHEHASWMR